MQQSSEAADAVKEFYERVSAGDVEGASATIAGDPAAFVIGTQRIGGGREPWVDSVRENAAMGVRFEAGDVRAYENGGSAWAVDEPSLVLPNGMRLTTRMTAVLERDDGGAFRLVHQHYSWAVPDEVAMEQATGWREQLGLVAA
jgi:ketosteroid isomerase-like protein